VTAVTDRLANSSYLRACRGEAGPRVPVWFQRQAGRSLPEYRAIRGPGTILDAIAQPDLATEITLQPVQRYGVDAAILYSDIVVPAHAIGFGVTIEPGVGPVIAEPFRSEADLARFRRQLLDDRLDESVDDHLRRLGLIDAAALQVEELFLAHLADRGLVADRHLLLVDLHHRVGVGARVLVQQ
jgi:hypothetical protein